MSIDKSRDAAREEQRVPLLPLRDIVVFPGMMVPLFVGRPKSVKALDKVFEDDRHIMLATQKSAAVNDPTPDDIYATGCLAEVSQIFRLPDGAIKALVVGKSRASILKLDDGEEMMVADIEIIEDRLDPDNDSEALMRTASALFERYAKLNSQAPREAVNSVEGMDKPGPFSDAVAGALPIKTEDKQKLLETSDVKHRLETLIARMQNEIDIIQIERRVRNRVRKQMEKSQRDYYLTEQMRAIQKELSKGGQEKGEFDELREKIETAGMPEDVKSKALKELSRLEQMPPMSAEGTVSRNYIDWLIEVPWKKRTRDKLNITEAEKILEDDHYGLTEVKERILEYLSVRKLVNRMKGPVLCFVGPPGVGKTSLGRSIARAIGRKFVRFSLGGVRDEAEIRGHRRTYIGSLPGRIIQSMKKAGTRNPIIMLDEVDKLSSDFRGDPSAALLEALDPEQNVAFNDHYLEVDYDLSEVMFITTANVLHTIPRPLLDRMEVITISGYTDDEKEQIARRFLIPKQEKEHGLEKDAVSIPPKTLRKIIRNYTRESGVRNLERELARVMRKTARKFAEGKKRKRGAKADMKKVTVTESRLTEFLGEIKFRDDLAEKKQEIGVATGLAWTEVGGALLKIETTALDGTGKFILTGKLGEVMKESAQAALSYIRSRRGDFGLAKGFHGKLDIHIHIPEGGIPKDGPSAGITLATSMVSALLKIPVRNDIAMTGEITLRGHALPIGGLKEKLLAAVRGGIKKVLIPGENTRDLSRIPDKIKEALDIMIVESMDEVLNAALVHSPVKKKKIGKNVVLKHARKYPGETPVHRRPLN